MVTSLVIERIIAWNDVDAEPLTLMGGKSSISPMTLAAHAASMTHLLTDGLMDEEIAVRLLLSAHDTVAAYYCVGQTLPGSGMTNTIRSIGVWPARGVRVVECTLVMPDGSLRRVPYQATHPLINAQAWGDWLTGLLPQAVDSVDGIG
jgi:hypothetical protein